MKGLLLAALVHSTACAPKSMTMVISPDDADRYPELVETVGQAAEDWTAAGYPGELKVVVSHNDYGPRWSVVDAPTVECVGDQDLACTTWFWYDPQLGTVEVTAGAVGRLEVVSHEMGHLFGIPHLADRRALMTNGPTVSRPTAVDVEAIQ